MKQEATMTLTYLSSFTLFVPPFQGTGQDPCLYRTSIKADAKRWDRNT